MTPWKTRRTSDAQRRLPDARVGVARFLRVIEPLNGTEETKERRSSIDKGGCLPIKDNKHCGRKKKNARAVLHKICSTKNEICNWTSVKWSCAVQMRRVYTVLFGRTLRKPSWTCRRKTKSRVSQKEDRNGQELSGHSMAKFFLLNLFWDESSQSLDLWIL